MTVFALVDAEDFDRVEYGIYMSTPQVVTNEFLVLHCFLDFFSVLVTFSCLQTWRILVFSRETNMSVYFLDPSAILVALLEMNPALDSLSLSTKPRLSAYPKVWTMMSTRETPSGQVSWSLSMYSRARMK